MPLSVRFSSRSTSSNPHLANFLVSSRAFKAGYAAHW